MNAMMPFELPEDTLKIAIKNNDIKRARELLEHRLVDPNSSFLQAVDYGSLEMVKLFIQFGANVNIQNIQHDTTANTPLMIAACANKLNLCRLLIENGAEVTKKNRHGKYALQFATENKHSDVCKLLLEHGAPINRTILKTAVEVDTDGYLPNCKILLTHARFCPHLSPEKFKKIYQRLWTTLCVFHRNFKGVPKDVRNYILSRDPDFHQAFFSAGNGTFGKYKPEHAPQLSRLLVAFLIRNGTLDQEATIEIIKNHHLQSLNPLAISICCMPMGEQYKKPFYLDRLEDNYGQEIEANIKKSLGISRLQCIVQFGISRLQCIVQ